MAKGKNTDLDFGDYVDIMQKRHGCEDELFVHKVIGKLHSNGYVDVPVQSPATETLHKEVVDVVACICCGVDERNVRRYRLDDVAVAPDESFNRSN